MRWLISRLLPSIALASVIGIAVHARGADDATNPLDPTSGAPAAVNPLDPSAAPPASGQNPLDPGPKKAVADPASLMRFETYVLQDDPRGIGGEVGRWLIPAGWKVQGGMQWDLSNGFPAQVNIRIYDPNSAAAFGAYPGLFFYWGADNRLFPQGTKYGGSLVEPPMKDQFEALNKVLIPQFRKDLANARIVDQEKLPKLSQLVFKNLPPGPGVQGLVASGRERFAYEVQGTPVVEDFYVVYRQNIHQRLHYENWAIQFVTSVRGPKDQMDRLREMHDVMLRSATPNVAWYSDYTKFVVGRFQQDTLASLRAGAAAKAQADRAHAVSDAERQQYEKYQQNQDDISEARAETTRGETPYTDTDGNRVVLPSDYGRVFSDGSGGYIATNDPNYDPNGDLSLHSTYTQLQQAPTLPNRN
jgi:hypothetical protein